ncbi:MAG: UxaA family hydrolase, partial [Hyphomonas sp.]
MNAMTGLKTRDALRVTPGDHVGVALRDLTAGERVDVAGVPVALAEAIGRGHKFALAPIAKGGIVLKYG